MSGGYNSGRAMQPPTATLSDRALATDWRPQVPTDEAVQVTHVDAACAKISCAKLGYFEDPWTEQLMRNTRPQSRSPLIHRGYYSRVAAFRRSMLQFLENCPKGGGVQIVNLGAGFDASYFWLRGTSGQWRDDLVYFEVDFPEVLSKKLSAVLKKQNLWPLIDATSQEDIVPSELNQSGTRDLRTKHLRYVQADMRMVPELVSGMTAAGFRGDVPTLFLSECVLVYFQALHGDSIIEWASASVPDAPSAFVMYEQTNPNDKFGKVMVDNLMRRGCPLLSVHEYPTIESQRERFMQRNWDACVGADMNQVYNKCLDCKDVERIQRLELLDEFEEWHLIQAHYFLLTATRGPTAGSEASGEHSWIHKTPITAMPAAEGRTLPNAD